MILIACAPSFAAVTPHRCDVIWLKKAKRTVDLNGIPEDPLHYLTTAPIAGGNRTFIDSGSRPRVCDAAVWRLLLESDEGLYLGWSDSLQEEIRILLDADALYYSADSQDEPISDDSTRRETEMLSKAVSEQVENSQDYQDLIAIVEMKKTTGGWADSIEGLAIASDLENLGKDAGNVMIVDGPNGRVVQYPLASYIEQKVTVTDVNFERLLKYPLYRGRIAQKIADDIIARRPKIAYAQAALADYRNRQGSPQ